MRVLMLAQFYPPDLGGEERHVYNLARALRERGHEIEVITTALPSTGQGDSLEDDILVHRVRSSAQRVPGLHSDPGRPHALPLADGATRRAIESLLTTRHFDVVHAHNWIVNSALGPATRSSTPVVMTLHDYNHVCAVKRYVRDGHECEGPSIRRCGPCAAAHYGLLSGGPIAAANALARRERRTGLAAFIAVSSAVAERNELAGEGVPYQVIPNFIPDELLEQASVYEPRGPLLYLGDLTYDKGVTVLLEAYRLLADPPPLWLIGRRAPDLSADLPPGARLFPPMPHDQAMAMLRSARVVIVPSIFPDPCPTVVLEAMATGRPVVGSRRGGIVDMVADQVSGLLVGPEAEPLAGAIGTLLSDDALAVEMGRAARRRVESFTASAVCDRIVAVYEQALQNAVPAAMADR